MTNRTGPRAEPWGTPEEISDGSESKPLTTTDWDRLVR